MLRTAVSLAGWEGTMTKVKNDEGGENIVIVLPFGVGSPTVAFDILSKIYARGKNNMSDTWRRIETEQERNE